MFNDNLDDLQTKELEKYFYLIERDLAKELHKKTDIDIFAIDTRDYTDFLVQDIDDYDNFRLFGIEKRDRAHNKIKIIKQNFKGRHDWNDNDSFEQRIKEMILIEVTALLSNVKNKNEGLFANFSEFKDLAFDISEEVYKVVMDELYDESHHMIINKAKDLIYKKYEDLELIEV